MSYHQHFERIHFVIKWSFTFIVSIRSSSESVFLLLKGQLIKPLGSISPSKKTPGIVFFKKNWLLVSPTRLKAKIRSNITICASFAKHRTLFPVRRSQKSVNFSWAKKPPKNVDKINPWCSIMNLFLSGRPEQEF